MRHPQRLPEVTGGDCSSFKFPVTSQSFVLSGCCSLGTSGLNREGSHISFQGNHDVHLCSEKFKDFGLLKSSQGCYILQNKLENCKTALLLNSKSKINLAGEDTGDINGKCQNDKRFHKVCGMNKREKILETLSIFPSSH